MRWTTAGAGVPVAKGIQCGGACGASSCADNPESTLISHTTHMSCASVGVTLGRAPSTSPNTPYPYAPSL